MHNSTFARRSAQPQTGRISRPFYQRAEYAVALRNAGLSMGARLCFEELVRACGRRAFTWIEQGELARRLGVSSRTVQRYEKALAAAGFLTLAKVSLWARWKKGGSRRLAVPHECHDDVMRCPPGVLEAAEAQLVGDGVVARAGQLTERRGVATRVSRQWREITSLSKKRKPKRAAEGLLPKLRRVLAGTLLIDGAPGSDPHEDDWRRQLRLEMYQQAKAKGYA